MADLKKFIITNWCGVPHKFIRHADGTLAVDRFEESVSRASIPSPSTITDIRPTVKPSPPAIGWG